jgi:3-phenylpropionate/cinnamic acid dioxygenase small subunit
MTIDELLAREAIRDLVVRYNSNADTGRFDHVWELFTEDAVMEIGTARGEPTVYRGLAELQQIFTNARGRVEARGRDEPSRSAYLRHFTATHQIDRVDADRATGRCYFAVIIGTEGGPGGLDHWGRYIDEYVRAEGRWRFRHRRVLVDGAVESSWFAPPDDGPTD